MDSIISIPSPQAPAEQEMKPPSSPSSSSSSSRPEKDPLAASDDEEGTAEEQSSASSVSSESDTFHSGGDDELDTAREGPFFANPDEETLATPQSVVAELETLKLIAQASEEGDVGISPSLPGGSGVDESGNRSYVEKAEIGVLGFEGKDASSEGDSFVAASEAVEDRVPGEETAVANPDSVENTLARVLDRGGEDPEDPNPVAVEQTIENGSEVSKEDILPENPAVDENVRSAIEEVPGVETQELQSVESKKDGVGVADERSSVDWKWWDLVVGTAKTGAAGVEQENGGSQLQAPDPEIKKISDLGGGSDEFNSVIEDTTKALGNGASAVDTTIATGLKVESNEVSDQVSAVNEESGEALASIIKKSDSLGSEENPLLVASSAIQSVELGSHKKAEFEELEASSGELRPLVAGQTFPDDGLQSEPGDAANGREISDGGPEISLGSLSPSCVSELDANRANDDSQVVKDEAKPGGAEGEGLALEEQAQGPTSIASRTAEQIIREMVHGSSSSQSGFEGSQEYRQKMDGQIMTDSDEEVDTDEEGVGKELFDSAALAELLKAASTAGPDGSITITAPDAMRLFSTERPAGLGSTAPSLRPAAARPNRPNIFTPSELAVVGEPDNNMDEEEKKLQEKIQGIRVKFLRLVQRLGHSPEDTVAAQVLYRLGLAEGLRRGRHTNRAFSLEGARKTATQMETAGTDDLDFSCNILILGKTGVGKSATINSIFGEERTPISAFEPSTASVKEIVGTLDGVKIRVIDTPGLKTSVMEQSSNRKILLSIKNFTKKCPPDIVLYIDRLDAQTRDFNDLPLLRSISTTLGPSIWLNAIVALTHAASAPPDGPNGSPLSYEVFIAQRSHIVQQSIRQAAGDMRLMNPVALVENHPSCRRNREGQRVLPNGQIWRSQLLLLCYSSKILSEANSLLKLQDPSPGKLFGFRVRSPPLPYLLSSLLQSRAHPKLSTDAGVENIDSDIDLDDLSDSDEEEEDEYDQLPPFKPLKKSQIDKLSKEQRKAYFEEYDYRVKLLQKKQWREELQRLRESKKRGKEGRDDFGYGDMGGEDFDQENGSPATVTVPLPDMELPPSFDANNPAYRYRFLEPTSQLRVRPVLDTHGWDHDCGYDAVSLEESLAIANRFPTAVSVQITKDKKEFNIHLDSSISAKHGEKGSTLAGFDIQSVGRQLAYILRGETKFQNFKKNKTTAGVSITFLGENVATGLKVEDQISIGKRVSLVASTGAVRSQGDMAYGANLEARLKDKEYPIGQDQSTLGLSLVKWRGDLALGANLQSQFSVGRNSKMAVRVGLNNKLSGQLTIRTSSSEQFQLALVGIVPVAMAIYRTIWSGESYLTH
ncbi:translocase of chloroplast 159, chloroplastic [Cinnamomum micranthum f. kanehirae]|uniref:Translocase of chloroplast 159, chloroplastic n=1 Tax=Cinnamomum micranthum f. kanehirae TaxID=337451 RepID=A0A443PX39_9MAGN|nr:translocase of chloroplast 159, chloroplastic [Cinnamomum micranthum f. kanehirae]